MPEIIIIECPFCKAPIKVMHREETYTTQRTKAAGKTKTIPKLSPSKDVILSDKCSTCGHTKKEIEQALKRGKQPSREEILRRMKEAGLPTKF